jgi:hypothetical protein
MGMINPTFHSVVHVKAARHLTWQGDWYRFEPGYSYALTGGVS